MYDNSVNITPLEQMQGLLRLMRPKQWVKNSFVLAPLVFTGGFLNLDSVSRALLTSLLFCVASSATYIINDIHDLEYDRHHPIKSKTRPIATGIVTIPMAITLLVTLYSILVGAWFLMPKVTMVIGVYMALNIAYTFVLKNQPVVDIFTIAISFVLRVYAGAVALGVSASSWMLLTTLCLALYLAAIKRRQELSQSGIVGRKVLKNYSVALIDRYAEMSATGSLFFYSMFVMTTKTQLFISIPIVLFGLFRYWYVVEELEGGESPADALIADWKLLLTVTLWLVFCCWTLWPA